MKHVEMFCDGSSLGNPGAGGYCAILRYEGHEKIVKGSSSYTTNNKMELSAVVEGIKALKEPCMVELYSDSRYVVSGINDWLKNWIKKDFKDVKNPELWKEFINVSKSHKIKANWVRGHNGHIENEMCDKIAKAEAERVKTIKEE